jgi:hypothetical protein
LRTCERSFSFLSAALTVLARPLRRRVLLCGTTTSKLSHVPSAKENDDANDE